MVIILQQEDLTIDYVEMGTLGNALDFGDLNTGVFLNNNSVNSTVESIVWVDLIVLNIVGRICNNII